jgi:AraC-like DNA-binding protein
VTIATQAGFADQAHLTRVFRRMTGTTPTTYRRLFKRR